MLSTGRLFGRCRRTNLPHIDDLLQNRGLVRERTVQAGHRQRLDELLQNRGHVRFLGHVRHRLRGWDCHTELQGGDRPIRATKGGNQSVVHADTGDEEHVPEQLGVENVETKLRHIPEIPNSYPEVNSLSRQRVAR